MESVEDKKGIGNKNTPEWMKTHPDWKKCQSCKGSGTVRRKVKLDGAFKWGPEVVRGCTACSGDGMVYKPKAADEKAMGSEHQE